MFSSVGFIGTGNMGGTLAQAAGKSNASKKYFLADKNQAAAEAIAAVIPNSTIVDIKQLAAEAEVIFLGVKPQMMADMLQEIAPVLQARATKPTFVTMAAGLSRKAILEMASIQCPIIRIMPNTPAFVGAGMILYCADGVPQETVDSFRALLAPAGRLDALPESMIDAGSAVSGCGPAYVYLFIEALADGAVACGVPRAKAMEYAAATVRGAAEMVLQTGKHPGALKDAVCSPGGTTIAGVRALEEAGFRAAAMNAVIAAYEKTLALKK